VITLSNRLNVSYIKFIVRNVTATLSHEGLKPSESAVTINRQFLEGKITSKEAIDKIKMIYIGGKSNGRPNKKNRIQVFSSTK
jgi:hypothetical protein